MSGLGRIAFLGTGPFGVPLLERLSAEADELLVISQPDRPAGRGLRWRASAVAEWGRQHGLRVEAPRRPCYKFNAALGYRHAVRDMVQSGYSGVYLSVLVTGQVRAGDAVIVQPGPRELSVDSVNQWRRDSRRQLF